MEKYRQQEFISRVLDGRTASGSLNGWGAAPVNIALCKYWGKRDADLNLPLTSSLSVSLGDLGSKTSIQLRDDDSGDRVFLDDVEMDSNSSFARRISGFLDLFRPEFGGLLSFDVRTENSVPTGAGLASSASGFAALVLALDDLADWALDRKRLSMLARLGSGSASRSLFDGFVRWNAGEDEMGVDSFAEPLPYRWESLRVGILEVSKKPKAVSSREGMNRTSEHSILFKSWPDQVNRDLARIEQAIAEKDFKLLGETAENNALAMHATMMAAWPPLCYWEPKTLKQVQRVWAARKDGLPVYLTMDAGPNIKLLFLEENRDGVEAFFPGFKMIAPFASEAG